MELLATSITAPEVYLVSLVGAIDPILVASFPDTTSCAGIMEQLEQNIFYVGTSKLSLSPPSLTLFTSSVRQVNRTRISAALLEVL